MNPNRASKHRSTTRLLLTCRDEVELIGDYLTNKLTKPERAAFEAHLRACRDCGAFLATYKKTLELTRSFLRPHWHDQPRRQLQLHR